MDEQRQDDQLEPIYNSPVLIQDIALKTSREQWAIEMGAKSGSGRSVLAAQHHDDDVEVKKSLTYKYAYIQISYKVKLNIQGYIFSWFLTLHCTYHRLHHCARHHNN